MSNSVKRRDFIRTASLLGASLAIIDPATAGSFLPGDDIDEISNDYFRLVFDKKGGRISLHRKNGTIVFAGATICANLISGRRFIALGYKHTTDSSSFFDAIGGAKRLRIISKDKDQKLDFEILISLYDRAEAITIEAVCKNASQEDIIIKSLEPIRTIKDEGGILNLAGVSKCITNGEMFYDAGTIHEFAADQKPTSLDKIKGVSLVNKSVSTENETIHSWWNAGLFSGYENEGLVLGYLDNNSGLGNILLAKTAPDQLSFLAETAYAPELVLKPGKKISSNRFMICLAANPYQALENYASSVGKINKARIHSIIDGWCSWFYTLAQVSENEVILNTAFAAKHLKPFGLKFIQVDEGYQRWHGDWEGNSRFPHGMKWLADQIKSYGFKAGIWISPYVISDTTEVFQKHPDWLLKHPDGSLKRVGNWEENSTPPADENPKRYCLDITHPGAAKWLHDLIDTIVNDWGYEMIKIDFVAWSILAAERYYDPGLSSAQVYRKGLEIMRTAAGEKCHILECGPGATTVGLVDSMRIEADINYGYAEAAWKTYFLDPACSAAAAGKRYYFHKRTWVNDVDHICMNLLTNQQSEAAATLVAMSGGNMINGDRLIELDGYKLEVLKKITPSFGEAAIPVDLFDNDIPSSFTLKIKKPFAEWTIAAFFNPSLEEKVQRKFSLKRLWLNSAKTYLAYDFWKNQFLGEINNEMDISIQPGSVNLISLHEKTGKPQFISTDRHVMQGAMEIGNIYWDETAKTLAGSSNGPLNSSHNLYIYVPGEHPWTWGGYVLFHDYDNYSLKMVHNNIIRVHVRFEKTEQVNWEIKGEEFFK